mmetsp:Transcript_14729/g.22197  ORF Transcript_14729/g.22197 Transcript_14729/m.22197 type:complete len:924 (-) Transcript_14729:238-3009(-)
MSEREGAKCSESLLELPGGVQIDDLSPLLKNTGMESEQISKLTAALIEISKNGKSINDIRQDEAVLNRWGLQRDSMLILNTMLDAIQQQQEENNNTFCTSTKQNIGDHDNRVRANLAELNLQLHIDDFPGSDSSCDEREVPNNCTNIGDNCVNMATAVFTNMNQEVTTELPAPSFHNGEWFYAAQEEEQVLRPTQEKDAHDMSTTISHRPVRHLYSPSKNVPYTEFPRSRPPGVGPREKFSRRHTTTDIPSPMSETQEILGSNTIRRYTSTHTSTHLIPPQSESRPNSSDGSNGERTIQAGHYDMMEKNEENTSSGNKLRLCNQARELLSSLKKDTARHIINGQWKLGKCIGNGSFGSVYTCMDEATGQLMAVKALAIPTSCQVTGLDSDQSELAKLCKEIEYMRSFNHPNIVRYLGATVDEASLQLYIFQEWVPGGSIANLSAQYGEFRDKVVRRYTTHILRGLVYLHTNQIIHRDIKAANILVDARGDVALADFGLCALGVLEDGAPLRSFCGTCVYMAPELLVGHAYGTSVDWWALGALIFEMASGRPPFEDANRRRMFYTILNIPPPYPLFFSAELVELLSGLLEKRAERRLGVIRPNSTIMNTAISESSTLTHNNFKDEHASTSNGTILNATNTALSGTAAGALAGLPLPESGEPTQRQPPTPSELQDQLQANKLRSSPSDTPPDSTSPAGARSAGKRRSVLGTLLSRPSSQAPDVLSPASTAPTPSPPANDMGRGDDPIKNAAYFAEIDWTALTERKLTPPWIPKLSAVDDVAYVPKRVRDRRSSSIRDEFGDAVRTHAAAVGGEARISRQTASFGYPHDADIAALRHLRERGESHHLWGDFSYAAPPRGETVVARNPLPVAITPNPHDQGRRQQHDRSNSRNRLITRNKLRDAERSDEAVNNGDVPPPPPPPVPPV